MAAINRTLSSINGEEASLKSSKGFPKMVRLDSSSSPSKESITWPFQNTMMKVLNQSTLLFTSWENEGLRSTRIFLQTVPRLVIQCWSPTRLTIIPFYANHYHPQKKHTIDSNVYKWSGGHFLKFQTMQTQGARSAKFFRVSGHVFLVFANYYIGSNYNTKSSIYTWDGAKFILFQEIPTRGAMEFCPFKVNGKMFLAVVNYHGDSAGRSIGSFSCVQAVRVTVYSLPRYSNLRRSWSGCHCWQRPKIPRIC